MIKKLFFTAFILLSINVFATDYYVSTSGNNSNNGLTPQTAWRTLSYAVSNASPVKAGDKVWVKAGIYLNENVSFNKSGKQDSPIVIEGYKNSPGDTNKFEFKYALPVNGVEAPLNSSVMPLFDGEDRTTGDGFNLRKSKYLTIKNIQIINYYHNLIGNDCKNTVLENIVTAYSGGIKINGGYGIFLSGNSDNSIVRNCISFDNGGDNIYIRGSNCLIENNISVSGEGGNDQRLNTDYYLKFVGDNNILRGNYIERIGNLGHGGHGLGTKAHISTRFNVLENNTVINTSEGIYMAYDKASDNIIRNNVVKGLSITNTKPSALICRDGAYNNIFENNITRFTRTAILLWNSAEKPESNTSAIGNFFRNNVFYDTFRGVTSALSGNGANDPVSDNIIANNTFVGIIGNSELFRTNALLNIHSNLFTNNIVVNFDENLKGIAKDSHWLKTYNNYYNCNFSTPNGTGNITGDPKFIDVNKGDFRLGNGSSAIDRGVKIDAIKNDFDGVLRPQGAKFDIGAFEKKNGTTGSVDADAGADVIICDGSETTLSASGGTSYLWSTGDTTPSIIVNPSQTTTYTVTAFEGNDSDSDEVTVTVEISPSLSLGEDVSICSGESIVLTAEGTGNFLWNTGETTPSITVNPSDTTAYSVVASACNTSITDDIIVYVNIAPDIDAGEDLSIESGSSIVLTASGNGPFVWSTGDDTASITVSPTATTTYTVSSTSLEGCTNEDNVTVTIEDTSQNDNNTGSVLVADAGEDVEICLDDYVVLTASGGGSYLWSTGEITSSITVRPYETTTYYVTVSDGSNIGVEDVDEVTVFVDEGCSIISNRPSIEELKIFPNPTNGLINIELAGYRNDLNINLYSLRGRLIYSENLINHSPDKILKRQINLSQFGKGVYIIRIDNNGSSETKKVLVI